jgi:DNA-binding PadR family transcriptional regulator
VTQTSASFYVLLALSKGPSHGLGIADDVAALTDGEVLLGPGTLYRCLRDLTRECSIERAAVEDPPGVTHRKYYGITAKGLAELRGTVRGLERVTAIAHARVALPQGA